MAESKRHQEHEARILPVDGIPSQAGQGSEAQFGTMTRSLREVTSVHGRAILARWLVLLASVTIATAAALAAETRPSFLLTEFRRIMDDDGLARAKALAKHVPPGVAEQVDLRYASAKNA